MRSWDDDGNALQANFGWSVASAGDTNGDGFDDALVGAPFEDRGQQGEGLAYLYLGGPGGPDTARDWAVQSNQTGSWMGYAVASAGDVNADGFDDVIVSAPLFDPGFLADAGSVRVFHGSAAGPSFTPDWRADGTELFGRFGISVASAGDVNGDGFDDVIIGEHEGDAGPAPLLNTGRAFVYLGSATGLEASPAWVVGGEQLQGAFGDSVASAGDVNGDGFDDVVVGAPDVETGHTDEGSAYVYMGSATGLSTVVAWRQDGDDPLAKFGVSVSSAGDVDADGFDDLLVGAPGKGKDNKDFGMALLFRGGAGGLATLPVSALSAGSSGVSFGSSVAAAGDLDGDGFSDIVVGAPMADQPKGETGKMYAFVGSAIGIAGKPTVEGGSQLDAEFGHAVASAGDVDGNGFDDVIVGAPLVEDPNLNEGAAFLYLSSPACHLGESDTGCP